MTPIIMTEEFWANSQLSIARYYGGVQYDGHHYIIVDKLGRDLFECSAVARKEGRDKAIEPGEPADLIREDFQSIYRKIGRTRFIEIVKAHPELQTPRQMQKMLKEPAKTKNV